MLSIFVYWNVVETTQCIRFVVIVIININIITIIVVGVGWCWHRCCPFGLYNCTECDLYYNELNSTIIYFETNEGRNTHTQTLRSYRLLSDKMHTIFEHQTQSNSSTNNQYQRASKHRSKIHVHILFQERTVSRSEWKSMRQSYIKLLVEQCDHYSSCLIDPDVSSRDQTTLQ